MKILELIELQKNLDDFITEKKKLKISNRSMISHMALALCDEIREAKEEEENGNTEALKEELIDVLFFALSIAHRTDIINTDVVKKDIGTFIKLVPFSQINTDDLIFKLLYMNRKLMSFKVWKNQKPNVNELKYAWVELVEVVITYLTDLGLSIDDIVEKYQAKHEININRQLNGY